MKSVIAWSRTVGDHNVMDDSVSTIAEFFARAVAARATEPAFGHIRNSKLHWLTWQQVSDAASTLAAELRSAGLEPGDRVAHISENRYEWIITDLALHLVSAVHVPIHVTLSAPQITEQICDSGAKLVFVSTRGLLAKFAEHISQKVQVRIHDETKTRVAGGKARGKNLEFTRLTTRASHLATILYTSGTTGRPRGVMLSHQNLARNAAAVCRAHDVAPRHTLLCILPLSHIYARTCDFYTWICSGSRLVLAENRETLLRDCQLVRPSALNAVPFVYQRLMESIRNRKPDDKPTALRNEFGGQIEMLFCGGAPLPPDVEAWYAERGMPILTGYGMTEASPVVAVSTRHARRPGTVGRALDGVDVQIANDGEILVRGPNIMLGYWQDEPATAEVIRDGWLRTGDLGELDADGFLAIRGRKKELLVLSTGKKVSPTRVESLLTASPLIDQAAVFGEGQCGLVALIVPAPIAASSCGLANVQNTQTVHALIAEEIKRVLATGAHEEQIHRIALLDRAFSIERGELTAKMSLCRTIIARNFAAELDRLLPQGAQSSQCGPPPR
jgi:long-chain acyl-CoA synthetase